MFRFFSSIADLLKRYHEQPKRRPRIKYAPFAFQKLELRQLLAGDVLVQYSDSGQLTITGDDQANEIQIITNDDGRVSVEGIDTTINGGAGPFAVTGSVKHMTVELAGGNDQLTLNGVDVRRWIKIEAGNGFDNVELTNVSGRDLRLRGGAGNDTFQVNDSVFSRHAELDSGIGDDVMGINGMTTGRDADIWTWDGDDTVVIGNMTVGRQLAIHTGLGDDNVMVSGEMTVQRFARVKLSRGNDFFGVLPGTSNEFVDFNKKLFLSTGENNDTVAFDANTTLNYTLFDGESGSDRIGSDAANFRKNRTIQNFETLSVSDLNAIVEDVFADLEAAGINPADYGGAVVQEPLAIDPSSTPLAYAEGDGSIAVDDGLTITGPDDLIVNSAVVSIDGFVAVEDSLNFTDANGISGTFDDTSGILTLTGDASAADYQTAIRSVTYTNSSEDPTGSRTIDFSLETSEGSVDGSRTISFTAENDAPAVDVTDTTLEIASTDLPLTIDDGIGVDDVDNATLSAATVQITSGFSTGDELTFTSAGGISGSFSSITGTLALSGEASVEDYQTVLRSVQLTNSEASPNLQDRTIRFEVNDGFLRGGEDIAVTFTDAIDLDLTVASDALTFTENDGPVALDSSVTLTGTSAVDSATVSIGVGYVEGEDVLSATGTDAVSVDFDATTGVLTFTGAGTAAEYQTLLQSVTFENISEDPTEGNRNVAYEVTSDSQTVSGSRLVAVTAVNDPLQLTLPSPYSNSSVDVTEGFPIRFVADAQDLDDEDLTFILDLDEAGISETATQPTINSETGSFVWTPSETGTFLVRIIVTNESGQVDQEDITFVVEDASVL